MNFVGAIIAGLAGTAAMTMLMYAAPMMGMPKMDIIGMQGSMFIANKATALAIGTMTHFMMGVVFALVYALVWSFGIGSPTWLWGLSFGAVHTVVAMVGMPMMVGIHPRPPEMKAGPMMMAGMLMGHLVYGLVVALVYGAL
ncbi:MAG: hypothetical protein HY689_03190 [Chloroflexi bacterium]|nr:hypothetical protein [Chloroflexota bacterium]